MKVAIIMGSTSDLDIMSQAINLLEDFGVEVVKRVISAHRTPDLMCEFAKSAKENGIGVIIAGAGGAAHVAGVVAGMTTVPVIGVPIQTKALGGMDSLLSIVQMPPGVPVATMAINGAKNAALYAVQILALTDQQLSDKLDQFRNWRAWHGQEPQGEQGQAPPSHPNDNRNPLMASKKWREVTGQPRNPSPVSERELCVLLYKKID